MGLSGDKTVFKSVFLALPASKPPDVMGLAVMFKKSLPWLHWVASQYVPVQSSDARILPFQQILFYFIALFKHLY